MTTNYNQPVYTQYVKDPGYNDRDYVGYFRKPIRPVYRKGVAPIFKDADGEWYLTKKTNGVDAFIRNQERIYIKYIMERNRAKPDTD